MRPVKRPRIRKQPRKKQKGLDILKKKIRSVAAFNDIDVTEIY